MSALKKTLLTVLFTAIPALVLAAGGPVNVNKASKQKMLDNLEGLTPEQADEIIEQRNKRPFVNVHELGTLDSVGWDVLNINQGRIRVGETNWGDRY